MSVDYSAKLVMGVKLTKSEYNALDEKEQVDNCVYLNSYITNDEDNVILGYEFLNVSAGCMAQVKTSKIDTDELANIVKICKKHNIDPFRIQEYLIYQVW